MKKIYLALFSALLLAGASFAQIPTDYAWAKKAGGTGTDEGKCISPDNNGNVVVGGYYKNTATFGTLATITAVANHDAFVAKYDSLGTALWVNSIGGTDLDEMTSVSCDSLGNVYALGVFGTGITAGTTSLTSAGSIDFFLAKYSAAGNLTWIKSFGGVNSEYGYAIKTDLAGNCYLAGKFNTATTIGTVSLTAVGQDDIFLAKLDSAGTVLWAKRAGSTLSDFAKSISIDPLGNSYITGNFSGTCTFYGTPNIALTTGGQWDVFIAKYDQNGNALWAKKGGGTNHDHGLSIDTDESGNSVISGYYQSTSVLFNGVTLTTSGNWEMFVARFNTAGTQTWAKKYGSNQYEYSYGVTIDKNKEIYFTGGFGAAVAFGTFTLTPATSGIEDFFIAKMDTSGNILWAMKAGAPASEYTWGNAVTSDLYGAVYATGSFEGNSVFGSTTLNTSGGDEAYGEDIFVCKVKQASFTTGIQSAAQARSDIYPNPTNGILCIASPGNLEKISVYNSCGQLMYESSQYGKSSNARLDLKHLPGGVYFVHLLKGEGLEVKKIIIGH